MDSIFASPEDFKGMKNRDKIRGLHLLEYFVNRCHEIGVSGFPWMNLGMKNLYLSYYLVFELYWLRNALFKVCCLQNLSGTNTLKFTACHFICRFLVKHGQRKVILRKSSATK